MAKARLYAPGPTMVPDEVLMAMAAPIQHHRTVAFRAVVGEVLDGLRYVFQTAEQPVVMVASGTGAVEGAIVSTSRPGRKALVVRGGKFGERWAQVCVAHGIDCVCHDVAWGCGATGVDVQRYLDKDASIGSVIVTHSETSTGAVSDLEAIAAVTRQRDVLLIADGITSVGAIPVKMDAWGVDVVVTGSQKALMLPPGLGFAAVSRRAAAAMATFEPKGLYLDYRAYLESYASNDPPYTPAVPLMLAARQALAMIRAEGIEAVWRRTSLLARATRAAAKAMGVETFARDASDSLTVLLVPDGVDESALRKTLKDEYGCHVAGGQGKLNGKVIRISHMGYMDATDTLGVLSALEIVLKRLGHPLEIGAGIRACQEVLAAG